MGQVAVRAVFDILFSIIMYACMYVCMYFFFLFFFFFNRRFYSLGENYKP